MLSVKLQNEEVDLLSDRAIYWAKHELLLLADLHLGKVTHFRKSGIAVPQKANDKNSERLITLLQAQRPKRVIFLGDLFHSHYNSEWEVFGQVIKAFPEITFELVIGNHDIMSDYQYEKHDIYIHHEPLTIGPFIFSHQPLENSYEGYNVAGHIHPAVRLSGKGRQRLRLPCFYFQQKQGLLPAFGEFTGAYSVQPKKGERVYVIVDDKVVIIPDPEMS